MCGVVRGDQCQVLPQLLASGSGRRRGVAVQYRLASLMATFFSRIVLTTGDVPLRTAPATCTCAGLTRSPRFTWTRKGLRSSHSPVSTAATDDKRNGVLALYARDGKYETRWVGSPAVTTLYFEVGERPQDLLSVGDLGITSESSRLTRTQALPGSTFSGAEGRERHLPFPGAVGRERHLPFIGRTARLASPVPPLPPRSLNNRTGCEYQQCEEPYLPSAPGGQKPRDDEQRGSHDEAGHNLAPLHERRLVRFGGTFGVPSRASPDRATRRLIAPATNARGSR